MLGSFDDVLAFVGHVSEREEHRHHVEQDHQDVSAGHPIGSIADLVVAQDKSDDQLCKEDSIDESKQASCQLGHPFGPDQLLRVCNVKPLFYLVYCIELEDCFDALEGFLENSAGFLDTLSLFFVGFVDCCSEYSDNNDQSNERCQLQQ